MSLTNLLLGILLLETSYLVIRQKHVGTGLRSSKNHRILLDTSVLIDGRIESIARSGLVSSELVIPRSVVRELQYMADKADHEKRERARYGLDCIRTLQSVDRLTVTIYDDGDTHAAGVDEQLLVLAQKLPASLCTIDYNLNKVAKVESVHVININELAHALRPAHLPGERIRIEIVQKGQVKEQGVGYLDDGTMVVVDSAKKYIGSVIDVEAVRMLQTEAGRMLFAKLVTAGPEAPQSKTSSSGRSRTRGRSAEDTLIESARNQQNR